MKKYLIYLAQDYEDITIYSFEVEENVVEDAKKIIVGYGSLLVVADTPAEDSVVIPLERYIKERVGELKELKKEYEVIKKKKQADFDKEWEKRQKDVKEMISGFGAGATFCSPFASKQIRKELLKEKKKEITTLSKLLGLTV